MLKEGSYLFLPGWGDFGFLTISQSVLSVLVQTSTADKSIRERMTTTPRMCAVAVSVVGPLNQISHASKKI